MGSNGSSASAAKGRIRSIEAVWLVLALAACASPPSRPFEMAWVSVAMTGAREAEVHFAMRDARRASIAVEGTLTLEVRAGSDPDAGVGLCRASGPVHRDAYRGEPLEASVRLPFEASCARAAPGQTVSAIVTLEEADGTRHRWPGVRGPFTAWMEALP